MKKSRLLGAVCAGAFIAGCASKGPILTSAVQSFVGQSVTEVIRELGPPTGYVDVLDLRWYQWQKYTQYQANPAGGIGTGSCTLGFGVDMSTGIVDEASWKGNHCSPMTKKLKHRSSVGGES